MKDVVIWTDGCCLGNPGPGGFGAILQYGPHRRELQGGVRRTTNNRMELRACIEALAELKQPCRVRLVTDSQYVVNAMVKGWARRWRSAGWMRNRTDRAENVDLWDQLLQLDNLHQVQFEWVRGHSGHPENERCDTLARQAAAEPDLPDDTGYTGSV